MAAIVAPVAALAPRVVAPKARASRTLRATAFKGARVSATPKVRNTLSKSLTGKNINKIVPVSHIFFFAPSTGNQR